MSPSPHVLFFPLPCQGPVNCTLKLAEIFCLYDFHVTFLNTDYIHNRLILHSDIERRFKPYKKFSFKTIPDGLPENNPRTGDQLLTLLESMENVSKPMFEEILKNEAFGEEKGLNCVIADGAFTYAVDVANEVGVPLLYFDTISPCGLWSFLCVGKLIQAGEFPFQVASFTDIIQIADETSPPRGQEVLDSGVQTNVPDQTARTVNSHPIEPSNDTDQGDDDSEETNDFRIVSHNTLVETTEETRRASKRIRSQDHTGGDAGASDRAQGERYDWKDWTNQDLSKFGAKLGKEILSRLRSSAQVEETLANSLSEWKAKYEDLLSTSAAEKLALSDELKAKSDEFQANLATANEVKSELEKMVATLEKERDNLKSRLPEHIAEALANYRKSDELANNIKMLFAPIIWFGYSSAIEDMRVAGLSVDAAKLTHSSWNRNDGSQIYETRFKEFTDGVDLVSKYGRKPPPTGSSSQSEAPPNSK